MAEKIKPVLTAKDWSFRASSEQTSLGATGVRLDTFGPDDVVLTLDRFDGEEGVSAPVSLIPAVIALANAALPDSDPRKITRERIALIRELAELAWLRAKSFKVAEPFATRNADRAKDDVLQFADALESYLPPE